MNPFEDRPYLEIKEIRYQTTVEIDKVLSRDVTDHMVATAEQARINRGITVSDQQMYMIRFQHPPSPRMIAVLMLNFDGGVHTYIAYYDEVGHLLEKGWQSGDIQKLPGSPFDA